jgi:ribosomal protein S18 acetylase RimI-like enzyme
MDHEGMLVEGFDELGTMAALYNYPYYPVHTESRGYSKEADWVEYEIKVPATIPEKAERIAQITAGRRGVHVLDAKKPKDFLPYAHQIFDVINETYADLFSFTPLTETQITYYTKLYFPNIVADYVKLLLDGQNRVAGFVIAMPSLSRALQKARGRLFPFGFMHLLIALKRPKYIDLYLGAVRRDLQGKGVDALLMSELARTCIRNHIISAESNLELEENKLVQALWRNFERRQHKRRRCYLKHLS